jgi:hypothetical protein
MRGREKCATGLLTRGSIMCSSATCTCTLAASCHMPGMVVATLSAVLLLLLLLALVLWV